MSDCVLGFDINSRKFYDNCHQTLHEKSSKSAGNYSFSPSVSNSCHQAGQIALSQPNVQINKGNGWIGHHGINVDIDSSFRNAKNLTNTKEIHQFNHEQYFNVPYLARGPGNPCVEAVLRPGEDTGQGKACNSFAREDMMDRRFHPLVSSLRNIQDPCHIVPEHIQSNWRRGGMSSREMLRNPEVLYNMGYQYNGKFWQKQR